VKNMINSNMHLQTEAGFCHITIIKKKMTK
jgi:hypothetical protein